MKHAHPHHESKPAKPQTLSGIYRQPIYSPRGELEGLLLDIDGTSTQVVLDPREQAAGFAGVTLGQRLQLEATSAPPSPKGEAVHAVFHLHAITSVDGRKPRIDPAMRKVFTGRVQRLNYAKHGEPNGVVLDSGDFIHLRPQGFRDARLNIGDAVRAEGEAKPMVHGGFVVEACQVNDVAIEPKQPKPAKPRGGLKHGPKQEGKPRAAH